MQKKNKEKKKKKTDEISCKKEQAELHNWLTQKLYLYEYLVNFHTRIHLLNITKDATTIFLSMVQSKLLH